MFLSIVQYFCGAASFGRKQFDRQTFSRMVFWSTLPWICHLANRHFVRHKLRCVTSLFVQGRANVSQTKCFSTKRRLSSFAFRFGIQEKQQFSVKKENKTFELFNPNHFIIIFSKTQWTRLLRIGVITLIYQERRSKTTTTRTPCVTSGPTLTLNIG